MAFDLNTLNSAGLKLGDYDQKTDSATLYQPGNGYNAEGTRTVSGLSKLGIDTSQIGTLGSRDSTNPIYSSGRSLANTTGDQLEGIVKGYQGGANQDAANKAEETANAAKNVANPPQQAPQDAYGAQLQAALKSGTQPGQLAPGQANPYAGANASKLNTASKFEQGFNQAQAASGNSTSPTSTTQGAAMVQQYASPTGSDSSSSFVQSDPTLNQLVQDRNDYMNATNQRASLTDTYNQMLKDSGIQGIDTQLINMKSVMDGSEQDIRNEITKAGGFATDSQVLALTNARNTQLVKDYNNLLQTRDAKQQYLTTAMNLASQDRQAADSRFNQLFSLDQQIADYQQKMQTNAVNSLERTQKAIGWDGILKATQNDPHAIGLIEKTYGMPEGGLQLAANREIKDKLKAQQSDQLDMQYKQAQINKLKSDTSTANQSILDLNGQKYLVNTKTGDVIKAITAPVTAQGPVQQQQMAQQQAQISQVGDILNSPNLKTSVGPNAFSRINNEAKWYNPLSWRSVATPGASNFLAGVQQLTSQLTLSNLEDAKKQGATFGALSEGELGILSGSASKLNTWAVKDKQGNVIGYNTTENAFKTELDKINNFSKLDYILKGGSPEDVGVQTLPDGTHWVKNSDGSMTQL